MHNIAQGEIKDNPANTQIFDEKATPKIKEKWSEKKAAASKMAIALSQLGRPYQKRAERMASCAGALQTKSCPDGHHHKIQRAVLCKDRACPVCSWRRSRAYAARTTAAMEDAGGRYILLTLTVKNCADGELKKTLEKLTKSFSKLLKSRRLYGQIGGYVRTVEITRSGKTWHPHIHALLRVDCGYFSSFNRLYIDQRTWCALWQQALGINYTPVVDVRAITGNGDAEAGAVAEVSKYISKNIMGKLPLELLREWLEAVRGRRLWSSGGCLKIKDEQIENELVHAADETATADLCPVCGQHLQVQDWVHEHGEYRPTLSSLNWFKARERRGGKNPQKKRTPAR